MKVVLSPLLPFLSFVGCRRSGIAAFARSPLPIVVDFQVKGADPRAASRRGGYAAALRAKLATRATVVPVEAVPPDPFAELRVTLTRIRADHDSSPAMIGTATGAAVGTLSAMAGDRDAVLNGLFWGVFAGSAADASRDWDTWRPGYVPTRVSALVELQDHREKGTLLAFTVSGREVNDAMQPMSPADRRDPDRVREEEAKAFALLVVSRLQKEFHWRPLVELSYYRTPTAPAPMEP